MGREKAKKAKWSETAHTAQFIDKWYSRMIKDKTGTTVNKSNVLKTRLMIYVSNDNDLGRDKLIPPQYS
jgi:hypothetical protein